ncbi:MAG TPA: flippase [Patescibacteria group bacterium]|nr:flippase [Patescibacteria group bacterium]
MEKKDNLNNSLKLIFKSSMFILIATLLSKVFTYLFRLIVARDFGPEIYGVFSLTAMILTWFVSLFSFGFFDGILRFIPLYRGKNETEKIKYLFRFSFKVLFLSSIFSAVLLFLLSNFISVTLFHNSELILFLKILSVALPFFIFGYFFLAIIQAYEKIKTHSFISDILFNFINLLFLIILISVGMKTNSVFFSYFFGLVGIFLTSFIYCRIKIPDIFTKFTLETKIKKEIIKKLFIYTGPLIFLGLFQGIIANIDSYTIGYFKDAFSVGIYNSAFFIAGFMSLVPMLFTRLFFPLVTREFSKKNFELIKELSKQVQKWIFIVNLPIFLLLFIFPGAFINVLFGAQYITADSSLRLLAVAFFFSSLTVIFSNLLSMIGKSKIIFLNYLAMSVINLILDIILVPRYGILGAAFASMTSYIIFTLVFFLQVRHYLSIIPLRRKMIRIIFSIIPPALLLICVKQFIPVNLLSVILEGLFFILTYILFIFLTKSLDKNDFMILKAVRRNSSLSLNKNNLYKRE